jgi:hypothetical protein
LLFQINFLYFIMKTISLLIVLITMLYFISGCTEANKSAVETAKVEAKNIQVNDAIKNIDMPRSSVQVYKTRVDSIDYVVAISGLGGVSIIKHGVVNIKEK